jgi:subtilase family serine protease
VGDTSEATPIFAGVVALADQLAGHRLGWINPDLYALGALSQPDSDRPLTAGWPPQLGGRPAPAVRTPGTGP